MPTTTDTAPRIYVASLSDYNAGRLHGAWIDATQEPDEIHEEVAAMLAKSREMIAEEWAIHDYEGFAGLSIHEWEQFEKVSELAQLIEEHGAAYAAYAEHVGVDCADAEGFRDAYCGEWDSEKAYAENYAEETGAWTEDNPLAFYVDWDKYARDMFMTSHYSVSASPGIYVFWTI